MYWTVVAASPASRHLVSETPTEPSGPLDAALPSFSHREKAVETASRRPEELEHGGREPVVTPAGKKNVQPYPEVEAKQRFFDRTPALYCRSGTERHVKEIGRARAVNLAMVRMPILSDSSKVRFSRCETHHACLTPNSVEIDQCDAGSHDCSPCTCASQPAPGESNHFVRRVGPGSFQEGDRVTASDTPDIGPSG